MPPKKVSRELRNATFIANSIRSAWSMGSIKTWVDVQAKGLDVGSRVGDVQWPALRELIDSYLESVKGPREEGLPNIKPNPTQPNLDEGFTPRLVIVPTPSPNPDQHPLAPTPTDIKAEITTQVIEEKEQGLTEANNYGWVDSPNQAPEYYAYWFQKKAQTELYNKIKEGKEALLLIGGTGTGKTFVSGALNRRLRDENWSQGRTYNPTPYFVITKKTVVEQTNRVFRKNFNLLPGYDMEVFNIEKLRSAFGQKMVRCETKIVGGEEVDEWMWFPMINPALIFLDESQGVKNPKSTQSKCIQAYSKLPIPICIIHMSATPFTNVAEAKAFCIATKKDITHLGFPAGTKLSEATWNSFAHIISGGDPAAHTEASVERLMEEMKDYIVRMKGVKPQFKAINTTKTIFFETDEERQFYQSAWDRYVEEKIKYQEGYGEHPFAVMIQFAVAAEVCKAPQFAKQLMADYKAGFAPVLGVKFKKTIIKVIKILIEEYGMNRNDISIIWGGGETLNSDQKAKRKIVDVKDKLKGSGIDIDELLKTLDLDKVEDSLMADIPTQYRLGTQSQDERQREIDKFQCGKSTFCFFTFKSGGVGLSLHHTDELTTDWNRNHPEFKSWYGKIMSLPEKQRPRPGKVRRKKSGFAVEEDIQFIPVRPRKTTLSPTYSAVEMVQGLGRCPRLTSLSETIQTILFYGGTIEADIKVIVDQKLRCLGKVVKMPNEKWMDIIAGNRSVDDALKTSAGFKDDEEGEDINADMPEGDEE